MKGYSLKIQILLTKIQIPSGYKAMKTNSNSLTENERLREIIKLKNQLIETKDKTIESNERQLDFIFQKAYSLSCAFESIYTLDFKHFDIKKAIFSNN